MFKPLWAAAAAICLLSACGPGADANKDGISDGVRVPDSVSLVAPSTPIGTVSGQVVNSKFQPLDAADVVLVLGGAGSGPTATFKATSAADGSFAIPGVPAGASGEVIIARTGYGSVRSQVTVPAASGNFPLNNGNANVGVVVLLDLSGVVKFSVLTGTGAPAKGAKGLLEVTPAGFLTTSGAGFGAPQGRISVEATVDDQGVLSFSSVPTPAEMARVSTAADAYVLTIGALDVDSDGRVDFMGTTVPYSGVTLFTRPPPVLVLTDVRNGTAGLTIVASNVDTLSGGNASPMRNLVKPADPINVVFNQPVVPSTLVVKVVDESCGVTVPITTALHSNNTVLTITATSGWLTGKEYNLVIRGTGTDTGTTSAHVGYFFGGDPAVAVPLGTTARFEVHKATGNTNTGALQTGDDLVVVFDAPIHQVGGATARLFMNTDLNGNGIIGNGTGDYAEFGSPFSSGFALGSLEPTYDATNSTFACTPSSYTTRWTVAFTLSNNSGGQPITPPVGTPVRLTFPAGTVSIDGYQTLWGQPFSGDISGALVLAP